ncbi:unnamed protein product [Moneuplotes crassus]|uniref:Uncharacterized protein n=1 Tax=Euplotes crassus TaxID=5936 RepID=A0AAD1Y5F9_EUPCR|nr:unnamed protein product [Moneuplotes crassus]
MQDSLSQGKTSSKLSESKIKDPEYDSPEENSSKISNVFNQTKAKAIEDLTERSYEKEYKNARKNVRTNRRNRRIFKNGPNRIQGRVRGGQRDNKKLQENSLSDISDSSSLSSIEDSMIGSLSLCNDSVTENNKNNTIISEQYQKEDLNKKIADLACEKSDVVSKDIFPAPIKRVSFKKKENFEKGFTLVKEGLNEVKKQVVSIFEQKKPLSQTEEVTIIQRSLKLLHGLSNEMKCKEKPDSGILSKSSCQKETDNQIIKIEDMYNSNPIQKYMKMMDSVINLREMDKFGKLEVLLDQLYSCCKVQFENEKSEKFIETASKMAHENKEVKFEMYNYLHQIYGKLEHKIEEYKDQNISETLKEFKYIIQSLCDKLKGWKNIKESTINMVGYYGNLDQIQFVSSHYKNDDSLADQTSESAAIDSPKFSKYSDLYQQKKQEIIKNFQQLLEEVGISLQEYEELESCHKNVDKMASILDEIDLSGFDDTDPLGKVERRLKKAKQIFNEFYNQKLNDLMVFKKKIEKSNSKTLDQIITFAKELAVNEAHNASKTIINNMKEGLKNSCQDISSVLDKIKVKEHKFTSNFMSFTIKSFSDLEDYFTELENMTYEVKISDKAKINKEREKLLVKISSCDSVKQNLQKKTTKLERDAQELEEKCRAQEEMISELRHELDGINGQNQAMEGTIKDLMNKLYSLEQKNTILEESMVRKEQEIDHFLKSISYLESENKEKEILLQESITKMEKYKQTSEELKTSHEKLKTELIELRDKTNNEPGSSSLSTKDEKYQPNCQISEHEEQKEDIEEELNQESIESKESSEKIESEYEEEYFKIYKTKVFVKLQHPTNTCAQMIAIPLSKSWKWKREVPKDIMNLAGDDAKQIVRDIREEKPSPNIGLTKLCDEGNLEKRMILVVCPTPNDIEENKEKQIIRIPLSRVLERCEVDPEYNSICIPILLYTNDIDKNILKLLVKEYARVIYEYARKNPNLKKNIHFCTPYPSHYKRLKNITKEVRKLELKSEENGSSNSG